MFAFELLFCSFASPFPFLHRPRVKSTGVLHLYHISLTKKGVPIRAPLGVVFFWHVTSLRGKNRFSEGSSYCCSVVLGIDPMDLVVLFRVVLGSFYAFLVFLLYPVITLRRIHNEEEVLEKSLRGYKEYKERVKYRLIPFVW